MSAEHDWKGLIASDCRVLVVDDEDDVRLGLRMLADSVGVQVRGAGSAEEALRIVDEWEPQLVVSDITMPGLSGLELLDELQRTRPHVVVVLITGFGTIEMAVSAMHRGAAHFITKPFENAQVRDAIVRFGRQCLIDSQIRANRAEEASAGTQVFISADPRMQPVLARISQVAPTGMSVLIQGESGTGKELVARAIHAQSSIASKPFLALNTAALPDSLLESELFGHVRGAFTGAVRDRKGIFENAAGGTVFLDEVGLMSLPFQGKLLRVLQEKTVVPLGTSTPVPVDFRLITATAQALEERIAERAFREDLYYRLNVVGIEVPPLRERPEDVSALATHFVAKYADHVPALRSRAISLSSEALAALRTHEWPGNVRELENCIQRALVATEGSTLLPEHLGLGLEYVAAADRELPYEEAKLRAVRNFQREYVVRALERAQGNVTSAAEACGMTRAALQRILKALDIDRKAFAAD
jgi:DNA-binding NtrC family response regulator